jgi:hypothetical protein
MARKIKENRLVVADAGWAESIPEWILEEIKFERLAYGLLELADQNAPKVGDAEVWAYLYTASLRATMSDEYNEIYVYLSAKLMSRRGCKLHGFMQEKLEKGLDQDEKRKLQELRHMIYNSRGGEISHPLLDAMREVKKEIMQGHSAEPKATAPKERESRVGKDKKEEIMVLDL